MVTERVRPGRAASAPIALSRDVPDTTRALRVMLRGLLVVTLGAVLALATAPAAGAASAGQGQVYVVQGLLGGTYDIAVDGEVVARGAAAKSVTGPLPLAAGSHEVQFRQGASVVVAGRISVTAGGSVDVVAHRSSDASMAPVVTTFRNDLSPVGPGKLRLAVAHTAAAPPADIRVDGTVLFSNVANAEALTLVVPADTYKVDIVPTATGGAAILGPVDLPLTAGTLTRVFAVGNVADGSMDAIVQALPVRTTGSAVPDAVRTGDGGQAAEAFVGDDPAAAGAWSGPAALGLFALAGAGIAVRMVARSRSAR